ncbi:nitrous oxide reductase family maturation protein NosD [Streptomyces sp. NPDC052023]|uniref:nitrous oxide reductase family maturation protein NosD n=1 Tax=Streptomyces sp. NPDC052023 TaxID=3365681 RepID=UPI0037CDAB52
MTKRHITYLACATTLFGALIGTAPASASHRIHVVLPGESIQKVVDAAQSGDTVLVLPGTYHESITVRKPGLTLRGMGQRTVIKPAAPGVKKAPIGCDAAGNGICVIGAKTKPVTDVTIADLKVTEFPKVGVYALGTDRLTVERVTADNNGQWGISQEHSTRGVFRKNTARGNGDAGMFLANNVKAEVGATDTKGTVIERNHLEGNRIGLTVRRLRNLTVAHNYATGNCAGMFIVGDENKPKAGALTVSDNRVEQNNKYCAKTARLPFLQGSGIVLTGAENTLVTRNTVAGHQGTSPLSGGIVLFKSMVGVTSERNRITGNRLESNAPADLVNQEATASANAFDANTCGSSKPSGLC